MIENLYIKNYLIIKEAEINFVKGLNILTGETGAGKSIILDSLSLILGERADYSKIKKGQEKLIVEGHFNFKKNIPVNKLLSDILTGETFDPENIILRRELSSKGTSRNFINDNLVNISDLKKFGDIIIDIHSQNDHQLLLNTETHLEILDGYSDNAKLLEKYDNEFKTLKDMINDYNGLLSGKEEIILKKKYLDFELKEINNLNLSEEDNQLENELNKLENVENISLAVTGALKLLYEDQVSSYDSINSAIKELNKALTFDSSFEKIISDLENSYILVKESSASLNSYRDSLNFDNERTEEIRNRLGRINLLKKKYGLNINELIEKAGTLKKELSFAENFDYEIEELFKKITAHREIVFKTAKEISEFRSNKSKELDKNINLLLKDVGFDSAEFKTEIKNTSGSDEDIYSHKNGKGYLKLHANGYNEIEFLIRTNKGSDFSPLKKSASGGEISRIMLVIKTVISEKDKIGILVFDEIDSGISGRIAQKVGRILKKLSKSHQLICITHLPQIAAMSEGHFHVGKKVENGDTTANIRFLNKDEKLLEVAKLISGDKVTEAATKSAMELIKDS